MKLWQRIACAYRLLFHTNANIFIEVQGNPELKITESELNEKMEKLLQESFDFESDVAKTKKNAIDLFYTFCEVAIVVWAIWKLVTHFTS